MLDRGDPGEEGKREGMAAAWAGASEDWRLFMMQLLPKVARRRPCLTTEELERERQKLGGPSTPNNKAYGPLMKWGASEGICVKSADFEESTLASNHKRPQRVWKSLIYSGPVRFRLRRKRREADPRQYGLDLRS